MWQHFKKGAAYVPTPCRSSPPGDLGRGLRTESYFRKGRDIAPLGGIRAYPQYDLKVFRDLSKIRPYSEVYKMLMTIPETVTRGGIKALLPEYRQRLEEIFSSHKDPVVYELRDVALFGISECERAEFFLELLKTENYSAIGIGDAFLRCTENVILDFFCNRFGEMLGEGRLTIHDTVCSQVATRHERLSKFAMEHDIIIFVAGKASSNGKVLCDLCKSLNIRTYHIDSVSEVKREWFRADDRVGICGATSTPKWLLEEVAGIVLDLNKYVPDWEEKYGSEQK